MITCLKDITNIFYINLEHRVDRKEHVESQLESIGLKGTRFNAIKMENGAIGCSMSHLKLLQLALKSGLDHILIVEDDILFLDPELFRSQLDLFFQNPKSWDVILFAGNNMPPYEKIDDTCVKVSQCQTTTGYLVHEKDVAKAMNLLYNNREYYNELSEKTYKKFTSPAYSWQEITKVWYNLFMEVLTR